MAFTFGNMRVSVRFASMGDQTELHLVQTEIADTDEGRVMGHLNCRSCWIFFIVNLKSVLGTGRDLRDANPDRVSAIEEAVGRVHGVENVVSTSRAGRSQVEVSFGRDINIDFAQVELNEQLGAVRRDLPLNAGQPQILPFVPEEFEK